MKRKQISIAKVAVDALLITGMFSACCMWVTAENKKAAAQVHTAQVKEVVTDSIPVVEYAVPYGDTSFKSYMDYRTITNHESAQWILQKKCSTDSHGLRKYGSRYVIAVGSYYAEHIGDKLEITLASGEQFSAIVGDFKADRHTDSSNRYTAVEDSKNVIEFIVDVQELDSTARRMGDISYVEGFDGSIERIEKIVE